MTDLDVKEKALHLCGFALEKKAEDLVLLDVAEHTSIADYFIICSGRSDRQVQSIAQGLQDGALQDGFRAVAVEGTSRGHWVLMDFSDVVVHIFYEPVRKFYDLDGLWSHAERVRLPERYAKLAEPWHGSEDAQS